MQAGNHRTRKKQLIGVVFLTILAGSLMVYSSFHNEIRKAYKRISKGSKMTDTACGPVEYTEFGAGPPMLIVHGAGGGYDQGNYFAKLIGGNYRWIAPSRFGFLGSPVPKKASSVLQADAYACLLDTLGIDQVGVVGISMGGPSSLLFALRYPHRIKSLALISAASHAMPPRPAILAAIFSIFLIDFVFWLLVHVSPAGLLAALGVPTEVQKQLSPEEAAELNSFLESIMPMGARRRGQLLEQHMSEYGAEQIRNIQAPTLVMHARDDTLVSFVQGEFSARNIPGAQLIPMEKGGHLALMMNMNAKTREKLLAFLEQYNRQI
jgi:pimeloyl-ACP methyl ester carboxylesterase